MFISFSWDKFYYIIKNEGDDNKKYFIILDSKKCPTHDSYSCGCTSKRINNEIELIVNNYINSYKRCSDLFQINNGKIKYLNHNSKMNIFNLNK